jgi:hypothetical protein
MLPSATVAVVVISVLPIGLQRRNHDREGLPVAM